MFIEQENNSKVWYSRTQHDEKKNRIWVEYNDNNFARLVGIHGIALFAPNMNKETMTNTLITQLLNMNYCEPNSSGNIVFTDSAENLIHNTRDLLYPISPPMVKVIRLQNSS